MSFTPPAWRSQLLAELDRQGSLFRIVLEEERRRDARLRDEHPARWAVKHMARWCRRWQLPVAWRGWRR